MSARIILRVLVGLAMPSASPSFAVAHNLLTINDSKVLDNANHSIISLEQDVIQASQASSLGTEGRQKQFTCLHEIYTSPNDISLRISSLVNLVFLSAVMDSPADEKKTNLLLARALSHQQEQIALTRGEIMNSSVYCSDSALVNIYAQKSLGLVDKATEAASAIENRLLAATR